jgi:hypothetical protein
MSLERGSVLARETVIDPAGAYSGETGFVAYGNGAGKAAGDEVDDLFVAGSRGDY